MATPNFVGDPWGTIFSPFTNFFESILGPGGGNVFYLIPVMVLTAGLWFKNPDKPMLALVFMVGSCALMSTGNIFLHASGAAIICIVFTALGITAMVMNIVFHRGGT